MSYDIGKKCQNFGCMIFLGFHLLITGLAIFVIFYGITTFFKRVFGKYFQKIDITNFLD